MVYPPQKLNEKAIALWKNGKYTDPDLALRYVTEAIENDPDYWRADYTREFIFYDLKRYQESIDSFTKAIEIKGDYKLALKNRAMAFLKIGQNDNACIDLKKVCKS
jgi:tetratricopeptide (TPR) repeat protein